MEDTKCSSSCGSCCGTFLRLEPWHGGRWLIHGHVHDRWKVIKKQVNVSVEVWDCSPVALEAREQLIKAGPQIPTESIVGEYGVELKAGG